MMAAGAYSTGLRTVEWRNNKVVMIDQTRLPNELVFVEYDDFNQVAQAIRTLVVRGAPAIGVSGAFGLALAARQSAATSAAALISDLEEAAGVLASTRPTAVNLRWGLERILGAARDAAAAAADAATHATGRDELRGEGKVENGGGVGGEEGEGVGDAATTAPSAASRIRERVIEAAKQMAREDVQVNLAIGRHGSGLLPDAGTTMTHCNAGALATVAYGTALGVIRAARDAGKTVRVIATETRPVQQGSRLTAFELQHDGIDVSLIPDTAVGYAMAQGLVDRVVVGADRILRTGHVYNKIGTYQVATLARRHSIPFYVAAPLSTFDMVSGPADVTIEQRAADELVGTGGRRTAPEGVGVINPAFDMTPPELVTSIITERGVAGPPYGESIKKLFEANY